MSDDEGSETDDVDLKKEANLLDSAAAAIAALPVERRAPWRRGSRSRYPRQKPSRQVWEDHTARMIEMAAVADQSQSDGLAIDAVTDAIIKSFTSGADEEFVTKDGAWSVFQQDENEVSAWLWHVKGALCDLDIFRTDGTTLVQMNWRGVVSRREQFPGLVFPTAPNLLTMAAHIGAKDADARSVDEFRVGIESDNPEVYNTAISEVVVPGWTLVSHTKHPWTWKLSESQSEASLRSTGLGAMPGSAHVWLW
jgi:hypothetical protein